MQLPQDFLDATRLLMGDCRFERYLKSFQEEAPVSIRLNPLKTAGWHVPGGEPVPWCAEGFYLRQRPQFTMDPLLHAGCYYVQEAASMFVAHILRQLFSPHPSCVPSVASEQSPGAPLTFHQTILDLCAAPGGKSTAAAGVLPAGSTLYSNEVDRRRASILLENITKWGFTGSIVTNSRTDDYRHAGLTFDVVLCDVPCSGEGLFRRDHATISEWSLQQVERCRQLQRQIADDAWQCLKPGGILIYSTCTFNVRENEENVCWMLSRFGDAELVPVATEPGWHITGSLMPGFSGPVFRFIPGITRSEGLFVAVLRKTATEGCGGGGTCHKAKTPKGRKVLNILTPPIDPSAGRHLPGVRQAADGHPAGHADPPAEEQGAGVCNVSYAQAIAYLRGEALTLPADVARGPVTIAFMGHPLGPAKNIGTRANNLYPKEWRIKTTHVAQDYEPVLAKT